jgi:uncharacterized protein (DUF111 family)
VRASKDNFPLDEVLQALSAAGVTPQSLKRALSGLPAVPEPDEWLWSVAADLDDCLPQVLGHLSERLLAAGARDVTLLPVQMKKGRPGVRLEALVDDGRLQRIEDLILTETPTLGLRRHRVERRVLARESRRVRTPFGPIRLKRARDPRGVWKEAPEYDDCRAAARRSRRPLREVMAAALKASGKA